MINFKDEVARRCMIYISKHFIERDVLMKDEFWDILALVSKELKEKKHD